MHQLHVLTLLEKCLALNRHVRHPDVQRAAYGLVPRAVAESVQETALVLPLLNWFRSVFSLVPSSGGSDECLAAYLSESGRMLAVLEERRGSRIELAQAFVAVAHATGLPVRLVCELRPKVRTEDAVLINDLPAHAPQRRGSLATAATRGRR